MKKQLLAAVSAFALAFTFVAPAMAQDDEADVATKGFTAGAFTLTPSISASEEYDDNIYFAESNEKGDWITRLSPKLVADLNTADKADKFQITLGAMQALYADDSDNNRLDYNGGFNFRKKLSDMLAWDGSADYRHAHSNRGDIEADPTGTAKEPPAFNVWRANTSLTLRNAGWTVRPRLGLTDYNFKDYDRLNGTISDQDYRDRTEYVYGGRVGYDLDQQWQVYVDAEGNPRNYDDSSATERDSNGGSYLAGLAYKPSKDISTRLALGYMNRNYDVAAYDDIHALDADAGIDWAFEEGSKFKVGLSRSIAETTDIGVGGAVLTEFRADLSKKLTEELTGTLGGRYIDRDYKGGLGATGGTEDRKDKYWKLGAGLSYALSEKLSFTADYSYVNNDSNLDTAEYTKNVVMLGVKYEF